MSIQRYRNGSHQVRGNVRRPFRHARRIQNIANSATAHSSLLSDHYFLWDPTEPVATRPLAWNFSTSQPSTSQLLFYTHDGNKNVSEVIASNNDVAAHYEYAPFGALTVSCGVSAAANPWRFSSEYAEDDTATVYYNYRHYEPETGRWMQRDPVVEEGNNRLFLRNDPLLTCDVLGLYSLPDYTIGDWDHEQYDAHEGEMKENRSKYYEKARNSKEPDCSKLGWKYILNCDGPYDESEVRFHLWDEERCMTFKVEKNVTVSYSGSYGSITFEFVKGELYTVRGTLHVYQYIVPRYKLCQCICPLEGPFHGPILPGVRTRVDLDPKEGLVGVWDKDAKILVSGQSWTIGGLGGGVGPISGSYSSSNSIN